VCHRIAIFDYDDKAAAMRITDIVSQSDLIRRAAIAALTTPITRSSFRRCCFYRNRCCHHSRRCCLFE
jgi:hypothetical protein